MLNSVSLSLWVFLLGIASCMYISVCQQVASSTEWHWKVAVKASPDGMQQTQQCLEVNREKWEKSRWKLTYHTSSCRITAPISPFLYSSVYPSFFTPPTEKPSHYSLSIPFFIFHSLPLYKSPSSPHFLPHASPCFASSSLSSFYILSWPLFFFLSGIFFPLL